MNLLEEQIKAGTIIVAKIGGTILSDEVLLNNLIADVKLLVNKGVSIAIIHGGGPVINQKLEAIGKVPQKIQGLRVTDEITLSVVVEVLGSINNSIVQQLINCDVPAIGFLAQSNPVLIAEKLSAELGFVGDIVNTNVDKIKEAFAKSAVPVIAPLGSDSNGIIYNINADHAAVAIASSLAATKLISITDVPGILADVNNPGSIIKNVDIDEAAALVANGSIGGGMLPKIQTCIKAVSQGVNAVQIIDGHVHHCLLTAVTNSKQIGSTISKAKEHS